MADIYLTKIPQGQCVMNPNGDKKTEPADVDGLIVTGTIPGERGSNAHNTSQAIGDISTECEY
jgi:hypothetical protein